MGHGNLKMYLRTFIKIRGTLTESGRAMHPGGPELWDPVKNKKMEPAVTNPLGTLS